MARPLPARLLVTALLVWVSGFGPVAAQLLHHGFEGALAGEYDEPCASCPDHEEGEAEDEPCPPVCDDCVCGPGSRILAERAALVSAAPPLIARTPTGLVVVDHEPPPGPTLDGLLRPPRA